MTGNSIEAILLRWYNGNRAGARVLSSERKAEMLCTHCFGNKGPFLARYLVRLRVYRNAFRKKQHSLIFQLGKGLLLLLGLLVGFEQ